MLIDARADVTARHADRNGLLRLAGQREADDREKRPIVELPAGVVAAE